MDFTRVDKVKLFSVRSKPEVKVNPDLFKWYFMAYSVRRLDLPAFFDFIYTNYKYRVFTVDRLAKNLNLNVRQVRTRLNTLGSFRCPFCDTRHPLVVVVRLSKDRKVLDFSGLTEFEKHLEAHLCKIQSLNS